MTEQGLLNSLQCLLELTLQERQSAQELDMDRLNKTVDAKSRLLGTLVGVAPENLSIEAQQLSQQLQKENRRNAYLIWSSLNWVRETMQFYGGQSAPASYNTSGSSITDSRGGNLLSGKI